VTITDRFVDDDTKAHGEPYTIISIDSHVGPSAEQLRPYCESTHLEAFDAFYAAREAQQQSLASMIASAQSIPSEHLSRIEESGRHEGNREMAVRLRDMDADGIAADVIFHGSQDGMPIPFFGIGIGGFGEVDRELAPVGIRIYNRWLSEFISGEPHRHVGVAQVPIWDVDLAVKEVEWARDAGLRSINLPGIRDEIPPYNQAFWEPLWAACEERGMTLSCHGGGTTLGAYTGPEAIALMFCEVTWFGRRATWYLIFGGVFERHPALKFVLTEQSGDWLAETLSDMDSAYLAPQTTHLRSVLPEMPSYYWRKNCFVGDSMMSHREAKYASDEGLSGNFMWGSDYPHEEGTWPRTREALRKTFSGIPTADVRQLIGGTAADVYGFDRYALGAVAARIGPSEADLAQPLDRLPDGHLGFSFREHGKWA
jgi:predicted TIM-barrel fold metal-dependent hydrolase